MTCQLHAWPKIHLRWRHMSRHTSPILQQTGMQTLVKYGTDVTLLSTLATLAKHLRNNQQCVKPAWYQCHPRTVSLSGWPAPSAWVPPILSWRDSRPYAVLQRTLDKDCRQAEELKQLVDEASRFHLGCQHQHSVVICSGTLLFSSRVLHPRLVTLCSQKSGRYAVELYHAPYLWYPPFYTSPMALSKYI